MKPRDRKREKSLVMTVLATPEMVNFSGKVHGGAILKLLDQVAYACASRYCGRYVVTLSVDQVLFKSAIHLGDLITFYSHVNYTGRTSMEVGIKVLAENPRLRDERHVVSCYFTMVAVDDASQPIPVDPMVLEGPVEAQIFEAAKQRKKLREDYQKAHEATRLGDLSLEAQKTSKKKSAA